MIKILNELLKVLVALVLGMVYMWFFLSFVWCREDMSFFEQFFGVVYMVLAMPCYLGIKVFGLRYYRNIQDK